MKRIATLLGLLAFAAFLSLGATGSRQPNTPAIREFMRQKLVHSQAVLEGIALEDFDMVLANARKLSSMSQEGSWKVLDAPEYGEHSQTFRRNVESLIKSAKLASLDGVTLAYVKVTMSCVECHKYVRGRNTAGLGLPERFASLDASLLGNPL
jgi:hypothetical protein